MLTGGRYIIGGRFWGGKGLELEIGVLEEIELLGVNIIKVFLPKELLGLIRLLVCLSLLLKEIINVPSIFWAMKSGSMFSIFSVGAIASSYHLLGRVISFHCICWGTRSLAFRLYFLNTKGFGFYFFIIKRDWNWVNEDVYGIDQYYNIFVHIDPII